MASELTGVAELTRKLFELGDPKAGLTALRASVKQPMDEVKVRAQANVAAISPGKTPWHKTYRGRLVGAGFAARNLVVKVFTARDKSSVTAKLGVRPEAFYALQFHELGTAKIPRRPWLVPAFEASKDQVLRKIGEVLRARIERIARQRGK